MSGKVGRNDPCPCGSDPECKHCCGGAATPGDPDRPGEYPATPVRARQTRSRPRRPASALRRHRRHRACQRSSGRCRPVPGPRLRCAPASLALRGASTPSPGSPISITWSTRPGRTASAGSSTSGRLVVSTNSMRASGASPSMSLSNWLSIAPRAASGPSRCPAVRRAAHPFARRVPAGRAHPRDGRTPAYCARRALDVATVQRTRFTRRRYGGASDRAPPPSRVFAHLPGSSTFAMTTLAS